MYQVTDMLVPDGQGIRCNKKYYQFGAMGVGWHYTANYSRGANALAHQKLWCRIDVGAHFVVDDQRILRCAGDEVVWHAGPSGLYTPYIMAKYPRSANLSLLGVEMCVNDDSDWDETYKRSVFLGSWLCNKYNWDPHANFERHYDCTGKQCPIMWADTIPGGAEAWHQFKTDVLGLLSGSPFPDIVSHWAKALVTRLYELGIVAGSDGYFRPDGLASRAEAAALMIKVAGVIGLTVPQGYARFKDVPGQGYEWASELIERAAVLGLVHGYVDGTFRPADHVTRGEFAAITANLLRLCNTFIPQVGNIFSDTAEHWAKADINGLAELGVFQKNIFFRPDAEITRAEMAAVIYRILVLRGIA